MRMNFINDVVEVDIFDENGKFVTKLDSLQQGDLYYENNDLYKNILGITDVAFRPELLKYIGTQVKTESKNDFEKAIESAEDEELIFKFQNNKSNPKFKLVAHGITYDGDTNLINYKFKIIIPNAELTNGYSLKTHVAKASKFDYVFNLLPYTKDTDEVFEIRLKEIKKVLTGHNSLGKPVYEYK